MKRHYTVSESRVATLAAKLRKPAPAIDIRDIADAVTRAQASFGVPTEQDRLDALAPDDKDRAWAHRAAQERELSIAAATDGLRQGYLL